MIDLQQRQAGVLLHVTSLPGPNGIGDGRFGHTNARSAAQTRHEPRAGPD